MTRSRFRLLAFLFLATFGASADIKVATLNCLLLFDPTIEHRGKVDNEQQMTQQQYDEKLGNLASMIKGYQIVGLQETGGKAEISALAARSSMSWLWERGNDTATGEEVGLLHKLIGWHLSSKGRVPELDRLVSKHLLVEAKNGTHHVYFLVIHLLRPMGNQVARHKQQLAAIGDWTRRVNMSEPKSVVVVLGDTNSTLTEIGGSIFGVGVEAGEQIGYRATHLTNKTYDRMVLLGPATWRDVKVQKPPYGQRPAALLKRVWTDHYLLGATLSVD